MLLAVIGAAVLYTVFLWWFSTGAILWLDRRPKTTFRWSLTIGSILGLAAVYGLASSMKNASPAGAIIAFTSALGIWGWHELSFLTGFISGPRKSSCPPGVSKWRRFVLATSTLIYHEVALAVTLALMLAITWGQPNQIGTWTFAILLVGRLSTKLNLFLGVPNFAAEFFPDHLRHLTSYMRKRPASALFPISIAAGCALAGVEAALAFRSDATPFALVGLSLIFVLTALALLEHAFMVLPLHDAALWRWALPASAKTNADFVVKE
jgi:putative photosynthetic complex assembly protein 2